MAFFGSGSTYLSRTYEPVYDRFECDDDFDDELRMSSGTVGSEGGVQTLDEVGYSFSPYGGLILESKKEKVEAVWKKTKVPKGTQLAPLGEFECGICMSDIAPTDLVVTACNHKYCRECMAYYLHLQSGDIKNIDHTISYIETKNSGSHHLRIQKVCGVACPHPTCPSIIEGEHFHQMADEQTWERFLNFGVLILMRHLAKAGEAAHCPENCGGFVQNCVCSTYECRERTSRLAEKERLKLHKQWVLAEKKGMELLRKWAAGVARQCPKCDILIEKNGGCDHMYCTSCKTHYTWSAATTRF